MNKNKILLILASILTVAGLILTNQNNTCNNDTNKFKQEYQEVDADNVFVYRDINEIITMLEHGTGIVYLGFPECPWCQEYVKYLNDSAKVAGISKIYYYNIYEDRKNNTEEYQKIVSILSGKLQYDQEGKERIYVPCVIGVKNGTIIGINDETSLDTLGYDNPKEYWTIERIGNLKQNLVELMNNCKPNICSECNK